MVHRAQKPGIGVGGHISTYASSASLYEVGFNHFWRGKDHPGGGDQVFFQGHASPGMYARAFLEGRLSEHDLDGFRQEKSHPGGGIPSYPHPRLMPDFWEYPTVRMGLGADERDSAGQGQPLLHHRGSRTLRPARLAFWVTELDEVEIARSGAHRRHRRAGQPHYVSTATCSDSTARFAATAKIVQELESFFGAPAGTSSRSSGAGTGTSCSSRTRMAPWST